MITSAKEFLAHLQEIQNQNIHKEAPLRLPSDEMIYRVDLSTRLIDTPEFLSVETDHTAETIFFAVDRYFETIDLSESTCVIQYVNAKGEAYAYVVPAFDIETFAEEGIMLVPWVIQGHATAAAGKIQYAIRFYHINEHNEYDYIINTQIASSKILTGMMGSYDPEDMSYPLSEITTPDEWARIYNELQEIVNNEEHPFMLY